MQLSDQLTNLLNFENPPQRIISLVPSITELLFDLGLEKRIVGRTKFCIHPAEKIKQVQIIGGTKNLRMETIKAMQPDLIIANQEENVKEQIEELQKMFPVFVSKINTLKDAEEMILLLGKITHTNEEAEKLVAAIQSNLATKSIAPAAKVTYLIWQKPFMTVGGDTFINEMLTAAGFENEYRNKTRYPELSKEDLQTNQSAFIFLSSEPYPFKEKHKLEMEKLFPDKKIVLVDGELFSWYGSRLLKAADYFEELRNKLS